MIFFSNLNQFVITGTINSQFRTTVLFGHVNTALKAPSLLSSVQNTIESYTLEKLLLSLNSIRCLIFTVYD